MSYPSAVEQEVQKHDIFGGSGAIVWKKKIRSKKRIEKGLIGSKGSFQNGKRKQYIVQERRESKGRS